MLRHIVKTLGYALLGALATKSRTGYELAQHMRRPIAFMWSAPHSQIYPELNRLAQLGLIEGTVIPGRGPRDTKRYSITTAGLQALAAWTDSPLDPEVPRSEVMLRVRSLWLTSPERALTFTATQRRQWREVLGRLTAERARFAPDDVVSVDHPEFFAFATLQYGLERTAAAVAWADWLLDQLERQQRGEPLTVLTEPVRPTALETPPRPDTIA
jgi:DNA-binding PadR family transcriptional regulator